MIKSVEKALRLLEILSNSDEPMRLRDVATVSEMSRSNALKMLQTLRDLGFVNQVENGTGYELTLKVFEIGARKVSKNSLVSAAHPALQKLSAKVPENIMLSIREGLTSIVIDRIESRAFVRNFAALGARVPLHVVSGGKAILAFAPKEVIDEMSCNLSAFTENTITNPQRLSEELATIRERGYATAFHEVNDMARGIAVPVRSHLGEVVAAISISGVVEDVSPKLIAKYVILLKEHAAQIEASWAGAA